MKSKILLLSIVVFALAFRANAQNLTLGVKGGVSIPNLQGGGSDNPLNTGYSSRLAADYGIFAEYHLLKSFGISFGLEYSSQGGKKDKFQAFPVPAEFEGMVPSPYLYADFKSEAKMNYLLIPVMARFGWDLGKACPHWRFNLGVGPFAGFLLNAHQITSGSSIFYADANKTIPITQSAVSLDDNTDIKDQLHKFNVGVTGFIGFSYQFNSCHAVFVEGGGNYGFLPIQLGTANGKNYTGAGVVTFGYAYTFRCKEGAKDK